MNKDWEKINKRINKNLRSFIMEPRKISAQELANLLSEWENPTVDTRKYYQCVMYAYEVSKETYEQYKRDGGLCQEYQGKYYIA